MPPHFEYSRLGDVIAPHWAYVLVFGLIAAIPWLRLHYSLRTLLITTTLFALALGTIIWLAHR